MIKENQIKKGLKEGKSYFGTFVKIPDPSAVEVLALSGLDFIVIDNEHTVMSTESTQNLIRAANIYNLVVSVRVKKNDAAEILQALDSGAYGVQVPQTNSKSDVEQVVSSVKYAPLGSRGYAASQRSASYGFMDAAEYARLSNENTLVSCYCETKAAIDNLDEMLSVNELDILFIGPFDLSQALGVTGRPRDPVVMKAIREITAKALKAKKAVGIIASDIEQTKQWLDMGIQYIVISSDLGMIASQAKAFIGALKI